MAVLVLAAGCRHDRSTIRQVQKTLRKCQTAPKGPAPGLSGEAICHTDAKDGSEDGFVFQAAAMFIFHRESDDSAKDLGYMGVS